MCATTATSTPCSPKTLILFGAPHKRGVTGKVLSQLLKNGDATVIDCFSRAVAPCDDCRACYKQDGCSKRDMDDIYRLIEDADRLIFLTPVYNRSFPAPMKAMVDRLQCYWAARFVRDVRPPIAKPKTAWLITVCGSDRDDGEQLGIQLSPQLTVLHVTDTKETHIKNSDRGIDDTAIAEILR